MSIGVAIAGGLFGRLNEITKEEKALKLAKAEAASNVDPYKNFYNVVDAMQSGKNFDDIRNNTQIALQNNLIPPEQLGIALSVMSRVASDSVGYGATNGIYFNKGSGDSGLEKSEGYLNGVAHFLSNPKNLAVINKMRTDEPNEYIRFVNDISFNTKNWIPQWISKNSENVDGVNTPLLSSFFPALLNNKLLAEDVSRSLGGGELNTMHVSMANQILANNKNTNEGNIIAVGSTPTVEGVQTRYGVSIQPNELKILSNFADYAGMTTQEFVDAFPLVNQTDLNKQTREATIQAYNSLFQAFKLGKYDPSRLDPNNTKFVSDDDYLELGNTLLKSFGSGENQDVRGMIGALFPFMTSALENEKKQLNPGQYIDQPYMKDYFKDLTGIDIKDIRGANGALVAAENSKIILSQIRDIMKDVQLAGGAESLVRTYGATFGETGFVAQIANKLGLSGEDDETNSGAVDFSENGRLAKMVDNAFAQDEINKKNNIDTQLGRLASLRVVAAFQMARAFDPSGRLSNMDVEIQLARLGGTAGFVSTAAAEGMLDVAIEDVSNRMRFYTEVDEIFGAGRLNPFNEAQVDAVVAVDRVLRRHKQIKLQRDYGEEGLFGSMNTEAFNVSQDQSGNVSLTVSDETNNNVSSSTQDGIQIFDFNNEKRKVIAGSQIPILRKRTIIDKDGNLFIDGQQWQGTYTISDDNKFFILN